MWRISLIVETGDEDELERIKEAVALAACPVRSESLTADHQCVVPWMMIASPLDSAEADEWRDDLNR